MLIRSQNKEILVNAINISIETSKKKATIYATYAANHGLQANVSEIGDYKDKEAAIKELDDLISFFNDTPAGVYPGIYQMK